MHAHYLFAEPYAAEGVTGVLVLDGLKVAVELVDQRNAVGNAHLWC